jgi:FtsP/CotA-like multicopper oxidase with cupredoxin domain
MFRILAKCIQLLIIMAAIAVLPAMAVAAPHQSYTLRVTEKNIVMADGSTIFGWGVQDISSTAPTPITLQSGSTITPPAADHDAPAGSTPSIPGPVLEFQEGVAMTINLVNDTASVFQQTPVSLIVPGLLPTAGSARGVVAGFPPTTPAAGSPVYATASPAAVPLVSRVRSFVPEAFGATVRTYNFTAKAGTYLYEDSTIQQIGLQMGVFGAVIVRPAGYNPAAPTAYTGVAYDYENADAAGNPVPLVISDFDPGINQAIILAPAGPYSTGLSKPKYFTINGKGFPQTADITAAFDPAAPKRTLIRLLNAGSVTSEMMFTGQAVTIVAEDGQPKGVPQVVNNMVVVPAGKTMDVILTPTAMGYFPVYDRALGVTNGQVYKDVALPPQGVSTFLLVDNLAYLGTGRSCSPLKGKTNSASTAITITDALHALRAAVLLDPYNPNLDVAPLDATTGLPCGNGPTSGITVTSAMYILQKTLGANPY